MFHSRKDHISGAPPVLKGPDSKKYTQLPFNPGATLDLIPKRFKMPDVQKYDGTSYPQEHITTYTTTLKGNGLDQHKIKLVMLKKFGETLTNGALIWYSLLPEHSIDSFEMFADSFIKAHVGARKVQAQKMDIFRISQGESKLLHDFMVRFQKERMLLPVMPDECAAVIRIKDDQLGFPASTKGRDREKNKDKSKDDFDADRRYSKGRLLTYERAEVRSGKGFRMSEYNFNVSIVELVSAMRNIKEAQFLRQIRSDPNQRGPNLWCEYHGTRGHRIGDCRHLCEEVATVLENGHLREFLSDRAKNNTVAAETMQNSRR
uniref:Retrotransposon gag domain-containing protein n=1 Tax=Nicotiana tabacum TaxID=4097 RepID=A0A1S3XZ91_TOBAC|nr:PREDICTED: uncharacterized protein LOC107770460 [Nicotiana tabacum]